MKKRILCVWLTVALWGCARNPVTGKREIVLVSESQEIAMGQQADQQVRREYGVVADAALHQYVQSMGIRLSAVSHRTNLDWHFTVLDSPVVNAFAIPGGYVYLTRGIMAYLNSEAELAGVLGHEIGHVTARHSVRQVTRQQFAQLGIGVGSVLSPTFGQLSNVAESSLGLLFLRFSRDDERQADQLGVEYAARASYDPREVSHFFEVLRRLSEAPERQTIPGWLSTHPDPPERVNATRETAEQWIRDLGLREDHMLINRDDHFRKIDGLVFGDNPREGFSDGANFYHPELQFRINFPEGWRVENTQSAILAVDPKSAAQIQITVPQAPKGTSAEAYARQLAARGTVPQSSEIVDINGNRTFVGIYAVPVEGGTLAVMAAFIEYRDRIFQIIGTTSDLRTYRVPIDRAIHTFQRLTDERILNAQPDRLKIYTAKQGDTLTSIAKRTNNPRVDADGLAVLNRLAIDQPITPGRLVKTVEPGY